QTGNGGIAALHVLGEAGKLPALLLEFGIAAGQLLFPFGQCLLGGSEIAAGSSQTRAQSVQRGRYLITVSAHTLKVCRQFGQSLLTRQGVTAQSVALGG